MFHLLFEILISGPGLNSRKFPPIVTALGLATIKTGISSGRGVK
jgi:hypothetical protein